MLLCTWKHFLKASLVFGNGVLYVLTFFCCFTLLQASSPNSSNENSPVSPPDEPGQGDGPPQLEEEEPAFPHTDLAKLDDMINR